MRMDILSHQRAHGNTVKIRGDLVAATGVVSGKCMDEGEKGKRRTRVRREICRFGSSASW